jgi:Uma2 family endonuclease
MNAAVGQQVTPEELLSLGNGFELIDGRPVEKNMGMEASVVAARIIGLLIAHLGTSTRGFVCDSETGYQIFQEQPNRVRKPDGSYISRERLPEGRPVRGHVRVPPEIAFEVVSPNDHAEDVMAKVVAFLQAGVKLLWVLYPQIKSVLVLQPGGIASCVTVADELTGADALPEFRCRVDEIFAGI